MLSRIYEIVSFKPGMEKEFLSEINLDLDDDDERKK